MAAPAGHLDWDWSGPVWAFARQFLLEQQVSEGFWGSLPEAWLSKLQSIPAWGPLSFSAIFVALSPEIFGIFWTPYSRLSKRDKLAWFLSVAYASLGFYTLVWLNPEVLQGAAMKLKWVSGSAAAMASETLQSLVGWTLLGLAALCALVTQKGVDYFWMPMRDSVQEARRFKWPNPLEIARFVVWLCFISLVFACVISFLDWCSLHVVTLLFSWVGSQ